MPQAFDVSTLKKLSISSTSESSGQEILSPSLEKLSTVRLDMLNKV
jgi:hypothetical protein